MPPEQPITAHESALQVAQAIEKSHALHTAFDAEHELSLPAEDLDGLADAAMVTSAMAANLDPRLRRG